MPTLAELLKENGVELGEEVSSKIGDLVERSSEVAGLVSTKNDLHKYKAETAPLLASMQAEEDKRKQELAQAQSEKIETAKKAGEWETVYKAEAEANQMLKDQINKSNEATRKSTHESAITQVQSMFSDQVTGRDIALSKVSTKLDETGSVVQKYKLGDTEFDKFEDLKAAMLENESYSAMIKAPKSSGGNFNNKTNYEHSNSENKSMTSSYMANLTQ